MLRSAFKALLRIVLRTIYRVEIQGEEYLKQMDKRTLVISNHTSFLDAVLFYAFIPCNTTFAINTHIANGWAGKLAAKFCELFPINPANPLSIRSLIKRVKQGGCVVVFPEGRITVTGSLMKVYPGPGLVADRAKASILPIRIDGAQYTPFSKLRGIAKQRWFSKITLTVSPPRALYISPQIRGRQRRIQAGRLMSDIMSEMMFETSAKQQTLTDKLLDARKTHGGNHIIAEDINRVPVSYNSLIAKSLILGKQLAKHLNKDEITGVLLPGTLASVASFWGLQITGHTPAMLNYTVGVSGMISACETAVVKQVITSRRFIEMAKLSEIEKALADKVELIYLEDIAEKISLFAKLSGLFISRFDSLIRLHSKNKSRDPAVILFTSGSEGTPKGVVLSHHNLLSNIQQLTSRIDFNHNDVALNALPLFHSFGLTAGMIMPLTSGVKVFFYPSPLHFRVIPEIAYDINATILFGTNTFLKSYARFADAYDFYSLRYVFAGAEKLQSEVRNIWQDKFGVRIFEGYGATETSPVLAGNNPMDNRPGTVGRLMPGIEYRLLSIPGLNTGKRLHVRGPNIMQGYLLNDNPGVLVPPQTELGKGWYDTGDIVTIDSEGFVSICGRAKRFAKIAGEMVSLTSIEALASKVWPDALHAAIAVADERKGEQILLLTDADSAQRKELLSQAKNDGIAELCVPKKIKVLSKIPILGTGKIDYVSIEKLMQKTA